MSTRHTMTDIRVCEPHDESEMLSLRWKHIDVEEGNASEGVNFRSALILRNDEGTREWGMKLVAFGTGLIEWATERRKLVIEGENVVSVSTMAEIESPDRDKIPIMPESVACKKCGNDSPLIVIDVKHAENSDGRMVTRLKMIYRCVWCKNVRSYRIGAKETHAQMEARQRFDACHPATTTASVESRVCEHLNGAYRTIPARWFGRREVFVCADCESVLDAKTKEKV